MNKTLLKLGGALLIAVTLHTQALATAINGTINFAGGVTLNSPSASTATGVSSWVNPTIQDVSGDFATFVAAGDLVTLSAPWSFTSGPVAGFWSVGGFTFDLVSSAIVFQGFGAVVVNGTGNVSHEGFDSYLGTWSFTSQDPQGRNGIFSFSGGSSVPEGGATVALLGLGLVGMGLVAKRRKQSA